MVCKRKSRIEIEKSLSGMSSTRKSKLEIIGTAKSVLAHFGGHFNADIHINDFNTNLTS